MKKLFLCSALMGAVVASNSVNAVEFDGFLTAGFSVHDQDVPGGSPSITYLDGVTDDISFDNDSKFGLQITADVSKDMQVVAQILASGADQNFDLDVEWAYLDYALTESANLRAGKIKQPVFIISDYIEVGYAYPWIRPPQEVYRANPINTINGLEFLFQGEIGGMNVSFQPYLGSNTEDIPGTQGAGTFNAENFYGAAFQMSSAAFTFQLSTLTTDVITSGFVPTGFLAGLPGQSPGTVVAELFDLSAMGEAELSSVGLSWDTNNFVGYAEFVTREITGSVSNLFPDQDAFYVTLGYRIGKYLPHLTFASSDSDTVVAAGGANGFAVANSVVQDSITLGLRYELNDSAALKVEYQIIDVDFAEPLNNQAAVNIAVGGPGVVAGNGLFSSGQSLTEDSTGMLSVAIDVIF